MTKGTLMSYVDSLVDLLDEARPAWEAKAELASIAQASLYDVDDADLESATLVADNCDDTAAIAALLRD